MSKVSSLHHIVISTKHGLPTLPLSNIREVYAILYHVAKRNNCFVHRIGGIPNHVHILIDLSPNIALSSLVRQLKGESSRILKSNESFPLFAGWSREYFATSVTPEQVERVIGYIRAQPEHHIKIDFTQELIIMHTQARLPYYANSFME